MDELFRHLFDEEELELDDKTKKEVDEARERVKNGEYVTLDEWLEETRDVWAKGR